MTHEKHGLFPATFYSRKKKFEQMGEAGFRHGITLAHLKEIRNLEKENALLKKLLAEKQMKSHLKDNDMVEVLIDTQNDKDTCWAADDIVYHINLLGVKKDDRGTPTCQTNPLWDGNAHITVIHFGTVNDTTDIDQGYMVMLALSWTELEQKPIPGLTMGINFANSDNNGKGRQLFDWVGAWPMRSPYAFGNLILKDVATLKNSDRK